MKMEALKALDFLEALEELDKKEKRQKLVQREFFSGKILFSQIFVSFLFQNRFFSVFSWRKRENGSSGIFRSF